MFREFLRLFHFSHTNNSGLEITINIQPPTIATNKATGLMQASGATTHLSARNKFDYPLISFMLSGSHFQTYP
jgi:hypothetical protein